MGGRRIGAGTGAWGGVAGKEPRQGCKEVEEAARRARGLRGDGASMGAEAQPRQALQGLAAPEQGERTMTRVEHVMGARGGRRLRTRGRGEVGRQEAGDGRSWQDRWRE